MLNTSMKKENGDLLVVLDGSLDALVSRGFSDELEAAINEGVRSVTIDAEKLSYISSSGLRSLLAAQQLMEDKGLGTIKVTGLSNSVKEVFSFTGFDKILDVE